MRASTVQWDVRRCKSMWTTGTPIKEIAETLGITYRTVCNAAFRYGWPQRKQWNRRSETNTVERQARVVTMRCESCYAHYSATVGDYTGHLGCNAKERAA